MLLTVEVLLGLAKKPASSFNPIFLVIIAAYVAIYFFYFRPRQKKARAARSEVRNFVVGDRVVTIGQMVATVTKMDGDLITLSTESGVELQFLARAIASKYVEPTVQAEPDTSGEDTSGEQH